VTRAQVAAGDNADNRSPNALRGEALLTIAGRAHLLRPTFAALVAAEDELGPLFALVERASEGGLRLSELAALFWHCLADRVDLSRDDIGEAVLEHGLAGCAAPLRTLLTQILRGQA
jgi:hypothetical protein